MPHEKEGPVDVTDEALIRGYCETGDEQLLQSLLLRYRRRLISFIAQRLGWGGEVDDVLQTIEIEIARCLGKCDTSRSVQAWIYGIASHKVCDVQRILSRQKKPLSLGAFDMEASVFASPDLDPAEIVAEREARDLEIQAVRNAMTYLPAKHRLVVEERYFGERRNKDIALSYGMTEQEVANTVFDSKKHIRKIFELLKEGSTPSQSTSAACA